VNPQQSAGAFLFAGVLLAFFVGLTATILRTPDTDTPLKHLLSNRGMAIQLAFIGTTIGPFCEELVFRGFLQPLLVSSMGRWAGILVTAFVFGVLHLAQNAFIWQSGLLIMIAGVAFGWIRQWTGSTKASTWTHMAYNSLFFFAFFATGRDLPK
jgi:membrane protease YdiL (CAAX protease family)